MPYTCTCTCTCTCTGGGGGPGNGGGGPGNGPPTEPLGYQHVQATPSDLWVIAHGLGFVPAGIQVRDESNVPVEGVVSHPAPGTTHIAFAVPIAGVADLS